MPPSLPQRRVIYRGRKIDLALQPVTLGDGSTSEREVVVHRGAVALVPLVDRDHVCLLENFRYTVGRTLLEVPAGTIDPGESPATTATRELEEETGYRATRIRPLRDWLVSPGVMDERMYLFVCDGLSRGATRHQPDEQLVPKVVAWEDALRMAGDGTIEDAKTLLALWIYNHFRNAESP